MHLALRERGVFHRLVIQSCKMDFTEPVNGDFTATSVLPDPARWDRFLATLRRHDRARIVVAGSVESPSVVGGSHEGTYVALRLPPG